MSRDKYRDRDRDVDTYVYIHIDRDGDYITYSGPLLGSPLLVGSYRAG